MIDEIKPKHDIAIIREPSVYVMGRQSTDNEEIDRFLSDHGVSWQTDTEVAGERLVEAAGRVCYMSFAKPRPGGNQAYIGHILEVGHGSVLEHAVWNLLITGVSRSLTHELIRHRAGFGYSQLSQRYVDESDGVYVEPDCIADDPVLHQIWLESVGQAHAAYVKLVEKLLVKNYNKAYPQDGYTTLESVRKALYPGHPLATQFRKDSRQAARSVLPNATETKIFVTANARALRHFIELRGSRHAETEIRKLAVAILKIMQQEAPNLFGDYTLTPLQDGTFEADTPHRKV